MIFTDEAGAYNKRPNEEFRHSHPFYIRSNVRFSADDYRLFQNEIEELNKKYGIPVEEEIKWSDLWEIHKGKYRAEFLKSKSEDALKGYYRRVFNRAVDKKSLEFIFTVTCVYTQSCYQAEEEVLKFHLQEAMQRVNMDAQPNGFATIIMDELNPEIIKKSEPYNTEEGCLSLLGGPRPCKRFKTIKVQWQTAEFQTRIKTFTGWPAQIIQHEIDHCNGILI